MATITGSSFSDIGLLALVGTNDADTISGLAGNDQIFGLDGDDTLDGGLDNDTIFGGAGADTAIFNVSTDGADDTDLGDGSDVVLVGADAPGQVRLTFTSSEVGNGVAQDSNSMPNQDGGLAVRMQAEDGMGALTGPVSRYDDEGITFVANSPGLTFDVRDLVSGAARGDQFEVVALGSADNDVMTAALAGRAYYFNGGMGNDTITDGSGNDFLVGGGGDDLLSADVGNDTFIGGGGNDTILGGSGMDTVAAFNITTDGSDSVNLGSGMDVFNVSASAPTNVRLTFTSSEVGNGNANDSNSMANQDGGFAVRMQAEDGMDGLTGGITRADDEGIVFVAGAGVTFDVRDLVSGTARGDRFEVVALGSADNDVMTAALAGRPYYFNGGAGNDTITDGSGNDFLVGGAGNDRLVADVGNDTFIGGGGNDTIFGGSGMDTVAAFNITTDGSDSVNLGSGMDVFNVSASMPTNVRLTFTSSEVGNGTANDSNSMTNQDGGLAVRMQAEDGMDGLAGGVTRVDDEGIVFVAGAGVTFDVRDLVSGAARGDRFEVVSLGSSGNDMLTAAMADRPYYFNGGMGNDTITDGSGNDFLVGGAGDDLLSADVGNDTFIGGGGNDTILGGSGMDAVAAFNITTDGSDSVNLGSGMDVFNVSASMPTNVRLTFTSAEVGNGSANDSNSMANQDGGFAVRMQAEDGMDGLTGGVTRVDDEGIVFVAGAGVTFDVRDLVSGVARGDRFEVVSLGTADGDVLSAAMSDRPYYFNGGAGDDTITDGSGNDFLVGGSGNDRLLASAGNDSFIGGGGNDVLRGGAGADTMTGGADADRFDFNAVSEIGLALGSRDVITDFEKGSDLLDFNDVDANTALAGRQAFTWLGTAAHTGEGATLRYQQVNGQTLVFGDVDGDGTGDFALQLNGLINLDAADFTAFSISTIQGTAGNDMLTGGPGGKVMLGLDGNDTIIGGTGADTIWGGAGADMMSGGAGADMFKWSFANHTGLAVGTRDVITDFQQGLDKIDLSAIDANTMIAGNQDFTFLGMATHTGDGGTLRFLQSGGNTVIFGDTDGDGAGDFAIQLAGLYNLTANDFVL